jgi:hypothetical protein
MWGLGKALVGAMRWQQLIAKKPHFMPLGDCALRNKPCVYTRVVYWFAH